MNDTKGCPKILSSQFENLAFDRSPQYIFLFFGEGGEVGGREGGTSISKQRQIF